jgi:hypothetical protein
MPFVQGHYTKEPVSAHVESACACCGEPIAFDVAFDIASDTDMRFSVEGGLQPLIFVKRVDFKKLEDPSIIDAF